MYDYNLSQWLKNIDGKQSLFNFIDELCDDIFIFYKENDYECRLSYNQMKMQLIKLLYRNSK